VSKFQFRKRKKIAKGISLNISKNGVGLSVGPKGAKISRSATGRVSGSLGIPGTGLSYRKQLNSTEANVEENLGNNSLLENIADKQAFISVHGPVFTNKEIRRGLLYLLGFFLSCLVWPLTALFTPLDLLINPFLLMSIIFGVQYMRESSKNQSLYLERVEKHLADCKCPKASK
jgi:hypothetical protein